MKNLIFVLFAFFMAVSTATAQQDSLLTLLESGQDTTISLLPERMMPTQRLLWGKRGLFRITGISPLTPKTRERELRMRRRMLTTHQILGYATLGGMIAQGIVGQKVYSGDFNLIKTHKNLAIAVYAGYVTTASLSLFAPPKMLSRVKESNSSIKWHKRLAVVHMTAMLGTFIFGELASKNERYKSVHRIAALTAVSAFTASMVVMTF